jgi:class 3 adenylate cyclase
LKILVIEDNRDSRQLIMDILVLHGFEVFSAVEGTTGIDLARQKMPDLILLDVNLPGMTGFEVCAFLKADPDLVNIPVMMLTAMAEIDNRVQGLGLGADDYITKPFNPRELTARIDARLRVKQASDELRATRDQVLRTFEHYVAPSVVEQLVRDPTRVALGGDMHEVTAFFADLRGFTTVAEHIDPTQLFAVLNGYLSVVTDAVIENRGTLDKFLGDGIMALFNVPLEQPDHPLRAVTAALTAQQQVVRYHETLRPELRLQFRIGIHTGDALVGNVGTSRLRNYTAIGDTINTASRIEEEAQGGQVLISESTYNRVRDQVRARELGARVLKGREHPISIYEVCEVLS